MTLWVPEVLDLSKRVLPGGAEPVRGLRGPSARLARPFRGRPGKQLGFLLLELLAGDVAPLHEGHQLHDGVGDRERIGLAGLQFPAPLLAALHDHRHLAAQLGRRVRVMQFDGEVGGTRIVQGEPDDVALNVLGDRLDGPGGLAVAGGAAVPQASGDAARRAEKHPADDGSCDTHAAPRRGRRLAGGYRLHGRPASHHLAGEHIHAVDHPVVHALGAVGGYEQQPQAIFRHGHPGVARGARARRSRRRCRATRPRLPVPRSRSVDRRPASSSHTLLAGGSHPEEGGRGTRGLAVAGGATATDTVGAAGGASLTAASTPSTVATTGPSATSADSSSGTRAPQLPQNLAPDSASLFPQLVQYPIAPPEDRAAPSL